MEEDIYYDEHGNKRIGKRRTPSDEPVIVYSVRELLEGMEDRLSAIVDKFADTAKTQNKKIDELVTDVRAYNNLRQRQEEQDERLKKVEDCVYAEQHKREGANAVYKLLQNRIVQTLLILTFLLGTFFNFIKNLLTWIKG